MARLFHHRGADVPVFKNAPPPPKQTQFLLLPQEEPVCVVLGWGCAFFTTSHTHTHTCTRARAHTQVHTHGWDRMFRFGYAPLGTELLSPLNEIRSMKSSGGWEPNNRIVKASLFTHVEPRCVTCKYSGCIHWRPNVQMYHAHLESSGRFYMFPSTFDLKATLCCGRF